MLMGATLPILVSYLNRYYKHIGESVGTLYFFNTSGSAVAALVTVDVLFVFLGQQATVFIAGHVQYSGSHPGVCLLPEITQAAQR